MCIRDRLLNHFEIKTPMTSYHEFNKIDKGHYLVGELLKGVNICLLYTSSKLYFA